MSESGRSLIEVPAGGRLFEGHFPGRPILPGVAQIGLVLAAMSAGRGPWPELSEIISMRLRRLVGPGDRLELGLAERPDRRVRLTLERDGVVVTQGEFRLGPARPAVESGRALQDEASVRPLPVEQLLPHRPPMRLLERLVAIAPRGLRATARVPAGCGLVHAGRAHGSVAIEAAAQAAAAWEAALRAGGAGGAEPRVGYLVAIREVEFGTAEIPVDCPFDVAVHLRDAELPLSRYDFEAAREGRVLARGQIATMLAGPEPD